MDDRQTATKARAYVIVPCYNAATTVSAAVRSAARQRGIDTRVIAVDDASTDGSADVLSVLAQQSAHVCALHLPPSSSGPQTPARPLNYALRHVLDRLPIAQDRTTWFVRLDADDVLAHDRALAQHCAAGNFEQCITGTLVFFDSDRREAHSWGPRLEQRDWRRMSSRDLFSWAHHSVAMRADLVRRLLAVGPLYDECVDTGEDLAASARIFAVVGRTQQLAWVEPPLCYKALSGETISRRLSQRRVWNSFRRLQRTHDLPAGPFVRGAVELALARAWSEPGARKTLQRLLTRNGHFASFPYRIVEERLRDLADDA
jgi:glycosyltransferase involved in cell wall biosynthesis